MAKKQTQPPKTENPLDVPDDKKKPSGADFGGKTSAYETPPQVPGKGADSPSESQEAAATASTASKVEPLNPPHSDMASGPQAGDGSMPWLKEDPNTSAPDDENHEATNGAETEAQGGFDSIDDVRRSLKEGEPQEESPGSDREALPWWAFTSPTTDTKSDDDSRLDARLGGESKAPYSKPASDEPNVDDLQIGEWFSQLEKLAGEGTAQQKAAVGVGGATGIGRTAEPARGVTGSDNQTRPLEGTHDVLGTIDEFSREGSGDDRASESYDHLRDAALQDFDETPPEADSEGPLLSVRDFVTRPLGELSPSEKRLLIVGGIVVVAIAFAIGAYAITGSWRTKVAPTPSVSLGVSHPVAIGLPGGWEFFLGTGKLQNGTWSPQAAEWLEGTEISRWVSLPWSVQLEAVFQTLKSGDALDLVMSNSDHLKYKIQSVQQVDVQQAVGFDKKVPCLLVMMSSHDSTKRWVITALPDNQSSP